MHSAIVVFTGNSAREIIVAGGSASWVINEKNAKRQRYLVCARNAQAGGDEDGFEAHRAAFLIGKIRGLRPEGFDARRLSRFTIEISDYADVSIPDVWNGAWRNPVKYTTLEELGIDPEKLSFKPLAAAPNASSGGGQAARPLTIVEAKQGLALKFGVSPNSIEIVIRG
jgi:hypothetical protein